MKEEDKIFNRQQLFEECASGHPQIHWDPLDLNAVPHVGETPVLVTDILARLYVHGSIAAVINYYRDITEEQIKEAISYSSKFVELVCYKFDDLEI